MQNLLHHISLTFKIFFTFLIFTYINYMIEDYGGVSFLLTPCLGITAGLVFSFGRKVIPHIIVASFVNFIIILALYAKNLNLQQGVFVVLCLTLGKLALCIFTHLISKSVQVDQHKFTNEKKIISTFTTIGLLGPLLFVALPIFYSFQIDKILPKALFLLISRAYFSCALSIILFGPLTSIILTKTIAYHLKSAVIKYYSMCIILIVALLYFLEVNNTNNFHKSLLAQNNNFKQRVIKIIENQRQVLRSLKNDLYSSFYSDGQSIKIKVFNLSEGKLYFNSIKWVQEIRNTYNHNIYEAKRNLNITPSKQKNTHNKFYVPRGLIDTKGRIFNASSSSGSSHPYFYMFLPTQPLTQNGVSINGGLVAQLDINKIIDTAIGNRNKNLIATNYDITVREQQSKKSTATTIYTPIEAPNFFDFKSTYGSHSDFTVAGLTFTSRLNNSHINWFSYLNSQHWFMLTFVFLCSIFLVGSMISILSKQLTIASSLKKLKEENSLKEQAQKSLHKLNRELEATVFKRTEELTKKTKEVETIINNFPDFLHRINKTGDILEKNTKVLKKRFRLNPPLQNHDFSSTHISQFLSSEMKRKLLKAINKTIETDTIAFVDLIIVIEGQPLNFECRVVKFDEESAITFSRDVTEKYQLEKELAEQRLKSIKNSRLASLGEMAGGIAHEINNPLTIIDSSSELIDKLLEYSPVDTEKVRTTSFRIRKTVHRMAKIIEGLKKLTRSGKNEFEPVFVKDFFEESLSFCKERFKSSHIELIVNIDTVEKEFLCNPVELSQVIINLLNNAYDAVQPLEEKWVKINVSDNHESTIIQIIDSGRGIPQETVDKIMQPFFSTKEVGKGTGLGLSISKAIVEHHFGEMTYFKYLGHTCFQIILPKYIEQREAGCSMPLRSARNKL